MTKMFFRCVVHGTSFYYGLFLPIIVILVGNWLVLILALRGMRQAKILKRSLQKRGQDSLWLQFMRAAVCATVLGITWMFGVFAVGDLKMLFQWLFCIFNSLQGFLIFLLFVVNHKEARREVLRCIKGRRTPKETNSEISESIGKSTAIL